MEDTDGIGASERTCSGIIMNNPIYIERQRTFSKLRGTFGPLGSISANGCGAIAVYNILEHFGLHEDFMKVISRFERLWPLAMPFGGFLGTNIFYLYYVLKKYGFYIRPIFFLGRKRKRIEWGGQSAILFFYGWRRKWSMGAHYQAGFAEPDGKIILHNPKAVYADMKEMLSKKRERENMWFCMALCVRK